jgi:fumarate hydratase subunit beta
VKKAEMVAYEDLGPEAITRLEVEDFPVIVVNASKGNDLYEQGRRSTRDRKKDADPVGSGYLF